MDVDDIGEQEVQQPYGEDVDEIMTRMDEVIDSREERPASDLTEAHHASPERPWMKVNIDVADRFKGQRHANLAINHEKHNNTLPTIEEQIRAVAQLVTMLINLLPETAPIWWAQATSDHPDLTWTVYRSFDTWCKEVKRAFQRHIHSGKLEENGNAMA